MAVVYFVGGFDGQVPSETYSRLMHDIASHGYVMAGTWPRQGQDGYNSSNAVHFSNILWVRDHNLCEGRTSIRCV